eukprot:Selendium_serpulae@DN6759_c0_g1_i1.p3
MPTNARTESLKELVHQLNNHKAALNRQLDAANEALLAAVAALVLESTASDDGGPPIAPPVRSSRRQSRAAIFGSPPPETKTPSRRRTGRGLSPGNRRIVARLTGPRLCQPMRHHKGPNN